MSTAYSAFDEFGLGLGFVCLLYFIQMENSEFGK